MRKLKDTRHWLCRRGYHKWGWSGVHDQMLGKQMCCERGRGCVVQYWAGD